MLVIGSVLKGRTMVAFLLRRSTAFAVGARPVVLAALALLVSGYLPSPAAEQGNSSKIKIAFIGDSTADGLWGGLTDLVSKQKCLKGVFDLGRFGKNGTGLTRTDKYSWAEEAGKIAENFKPNLIVVSLGLNDRQPIVEPLATGGRRVTQYESADWPARYKAQASSVLRGAGSGKIPVLWVGLAAMRDAEVNRDVQQKNKIFAAAVTELAASNVQYVAPWHLNESGEDVFTSYAPGKDGKMTHIRAPDGEHFTAAGDDLVAAFLMPKIVANLKASGTEINTSCVIASE
jgi:uncharacterized protein